MCKKNNSKDPHGDKRNDSSQNPTDKDTTTDAPGPHVCAINGSNRGRCRAWEAGGLTPAMRCFAQHHHWHDPGIYTNKRLLRRVFAKPIANAVAELALNGKTATGQQIQTDFALLQKITRSLDRMCIKRIDEDDEEVVFEHIKGQLKKMLTDLAAMLDGGQKSARKIVDIAPAEAKPPAAVNGSGGTSENTQETPVKDSKTEWITYKKAAGLLGIKKSAVSKWTQKGRLTDNGKKGRKKRLSKTSVLLVKQEIDDEYIENYADALQMDTGKIR